MRIQQLDQIPDEALDLSQFLAVDDPSQTFKMTLLQLRDFMAAFFNAQYVHKGGDILTGSLGVADPTGTNSSIYGNALGGLFANMKTHPAVLDTGSVTDGNLYAPVWKGRYVHNGGWDGTYSWGILNKGAADPGSFTLAHVNGAGTQDWQWSFEGSTGAIKAKGAGFVAHDPATGWQVQLCATGNVPRWDALASDGTVRARLDWYEDGGVVTLRNYLHNRNIHINVDGLNSSGPVLTHEAQSAYGNSLTRKDYVDGKTSRFIGNPGGTWDANVAAPGAKMACVTLMHGGRLYPITFPVLNNYSYWMKERGGESADRDYDIGLSCWFDGYSLGISTTFGALQPERPVIADIFVW